MKKVVIGFVGCLMLLGVYAAQNGGKKPHEGGKAGEALHTSRNAFVEVTAPAGLRVKWVSEDDFVLLRGNRAATGSEKVTIRARPGWKLTEPKDGVMELISGKMMAYAVRSELGEDNGGGGGHTCDNKTTVVTNCVASPVLSATLSSDSPYWKLSTVATMDVSISGEVSVDEPGMHDIITTIVPCSVCGAPTASTTTNSVTVTPTSFLWNWTLGDTNGCANGASFSDIVTLASSGLIPFSATVEATGIESCCDCQAEAETEVEIRLVTVTPDKTSIDLLRGESDTITFTVSPTNAPVVFSASTDSEYLSASVNGNVVTIQNLINPSDPVAHEDAGTVTITYSMGGGSKALATNPQNNKKTQVKADIQPTRGPLEETPIIKYTFLTVNLYKSFSEWVWFSGDIDLLDTAWEYGSAYISNTSGAFLKTELEYNGMSANYATFVANLIKPKITNGLTLQNPTKKPITVQNAKIRESMQFNCASTMSPSAFGTSISLKQIPLGGDGIYGTATLAQLYKTLDDGDYTLLSSFNGTSSTLSLSVNNSSGGSISFSTSLGIDNHFGSIDISCSWKLALSYSLSF